MHYIEEQFVYGNDDILFVNDNETFYCYQYIDDYNEKNFKNCEMGYIMYSNGQVNSGPGYDSWYKNKALQMEVFDIHLDYNDSSPKIGVEIYSHYYMKAPYSSSGWFFEDLYYMNININDECNASWPTQEQKDNSENKLRPTDTISFYLSLPNCNIDVSSEPLDIWFYGYGEKGYSDSYKRTYDLTSSNNYYIYFFDSNYAEIWIPTSVQIDPRTLEETYSYEKIILESNPLFLQKYPQNSIETIMTLTYYDESLERQLMLDENVTIEINDILGYDETTFNTRWIKDKTYVEDGYKYDLMVDDYFYYNEETKLVEKGYSPNAKKEFILPSNYSDNYGTITFDFWTDSYYRKNFSIEIPIGNSYSMIGENGKYTINEYFYEFNMKEITSHYSFIEGELYNNLPNSWIELQEWKII